MTFDEKPDVEVRVDEDWWPGEVRSWSSSPSGWWANCSWHGAIGETQLGTLHARSLSEHRGSGASQLILQSGDARPP